MCLAWRNRLLLPMWSEWPCVLITTVMSFGVNWCSFNSEIWVKENQANVFHSNYINFTFNYSIAIPCSHCVHNNVVVLWFNQCARTVGQHIFVVLVVGIGNTVTLKKDVNEIHCWLLAIFITALFYLLCVCLLEIFVFVIIYGMTRLTEFRKEQIIKDEVKFYERK